MNNLKRIFSTPLFLAIVVSLSACGEFPFNDTSSSYFQAFADTRENIGEESNSAQISASEHSAIIVDAQYVPDYSGEPFVVINDNIPAFSSDELTEESFESYSDLDSLGRCQTALANIGTDLMPTQERGSISSVKPTGWHSIKYDIVDGESLYNRCHLIGWQLTGENANEENLITGTRYLNVEGMLPFENLVADYIKETDNHVLYRVTPVFEGNNLVADGVLMEAMSVEDEGESVMFNVFCYNVQPGIYIDYATGESCESDGFNEYDASGDSDTYEEDNSVQKESYSAESSAVKSDEELSYVLNTKSKKFHYPSCSSTESINESNKEEYTGYRSELIEMGYEPCKACNP